MILDAHLHLPVLSDPNDYQEAVKKLLSDYAQFGIDKAIVIPDNVLSTIADTLTLKELIKNHRDKLSMVGSPNILKKDPMSELEMIKQLHAEKSICAIKIFPGHDEHYPNDPRLEQFFQYCETSHLPVLIHTGWNSGNSVVAQWNDPKYIVDIAKRFPKLKVVIAHYFWPKVEYCYEITRGLTNIFFDTSALGDQEVIDESGYDNILNVLRKSLIDKPDSVIFGTDYDMCDVKNHIKLIDDLKLTPSLRHKVMWQNGLDVYGV